MYHLLIYIWTNKNKNEFKIMNSFKMVEYYLAINGKIARQQQFLCHLDTQI